MSPIIVGAGVGGLTAALALHAAGQQSILFEQSSEASELGAGIILLPAAVGALRQLGLLDEIEAAGIRTGTLVVASRSGAAIGHRSRGLNGASEPPLVSIARSKLIEILLYAVRDRLGAGCLRTGCRLEAISQTPKQVVARFRDGATNQTFETTTSCLIGADGISSTTRALLDPREGPASWSGYMLWRGATEWPVWEDGRTMLVASEANAKFIFYPISRDCTKPDHLVANWAVTMHLGDRVFVEHGRTNTDHWPRLAGQFEIEELIGRRFQFGQVDLRGLIRQTREIFEYPILDRKPPNRWTRGRVTLLGDAAHPGHRNRSNGATRAILDAFCLSRWFSHSSSYAAIRGYEAERRTAPTHELLATRAVRPPIEQALFR